MAAAKSYSTADVPLEYLRFIFLVGKVPLRALKSEPRISYMLYVPPEHYNPDPKRQVTADKESLHPQYLLPKLPLIVNIHGTGRDAGACRNRLIPLADAERVAILAPMYPCGLDDYQDLNNYKNLRSRTIHSDTALLKMLDEVAIIWPGIDTQKVFLTGFSGGGQFVHRFVYLHPERLHAASIGAPGTGTLMDPTQQWPCGTKDMEEWFGDGAKIDIEQIKALKGVQFVIGGEDNIPYATENFWKWMRDFNKCEGDTSVDESPAIPRIGRLDLIKELRENWSREGIVSTFDIVAGVGHNSGGVQKVVDSFLRPLIRELAASEALNKLTLA